MQLSWTDKPRFPVARASYLLEPRLQCGPSACVPRSRRHCATHLRYRHSCLGAARAPSAVVI